MFEYKSNETSIMFDLSILNIFNVQDISDIYPISAYIMTIMTGSIYCLNSQFYSQALEYNQIKFVNKYSCYDNK
jgi:hypothetical protein